MKSLHVIFLVSIQLLMCFIFVARYTQFQSVRILEGYSKPCNPEINVDLNSIHGGIEKETFVAENSDRYNIESEYLNNFNPKSKDYIKKGHTDSKNEITNSNYEKNSHGNEKMSQLIASHVKLLAVQNMANEFSRESSAYQEIEKLEAQNMQTFKDRSTSTKRTKTTEEAMLFGDINVTVGEQQKSSYRLSHPIPSSESRNILIVTRGRSGSSFLGSLIAQHPGTFYSFEPLNLDRLHDITNYEMKTMEQNNLLKQVFKCVPEKEYIDVPRIWSLGLENNFRLHQFCDRVLQNSEACYMPEVYHSVCPIFPIRLIKTIRLPFEEANTLLMDPEIGKTLKVIFLFRDQRGVLQSMKSKVNWCMRRPKICNISTFCKESQTDVTSALKLKNRYPDRVRILRYEDLCFNISKEAKDLLNFLDLSPSVFVDEYISTHTHKDGDTSEKNGYTYQEIGGWITRRKAAYSTYRDTNAQAFEWRNHIKASDVLKIQKECLEPMKILGYRSMKNVSMNLHDEDYILMDPKPKELFS